MNELEKAISHEEFMRLVYECSAENGLNLLAALLEGKGKVLTLYNHDSNMCVVIEMNLESSLASCIQFHEMTDGWTI